MPSDPEVAQLQADVAELKKQIELFKAHQHLGQDGSMEFQGDTNFRGRTLTMAGGRRHNDRLDLPISLVDNSDSDVLNPKDKSSRVAAYGIFIHSKFTDNEENEAIMFAGKQFPPERATTPLNQLDWSEGAEIQVHADVLPFSESAASGPSVFGPLRYLFAEGTPIVSGTGTVSNGGSTVTDSLANFVDNQFAGCQISILDDEGFAVAAYKVYSNTNNVITMVEGDYSNFASFPGTTKSYTYFITSPVLLGSSPNPFDRLYVGQDIRMGYGLSGGTQTRYIKWGYGSPEGRITANIGSIFTRFDGTSGNTLYIKSSDDGLATGWEKVTTTPA